MFSKYRKNLEKSKSPHTLPAPKNHLKLSAHDAPYGSTKPRQVLLLSQQEAALPGPPQWLLEVDPLARAATVAALLEDPKGFFGQGFPWRKLWHLLSLTRPETHLFLATKCYTYSGCVPEQTDEHKDISSHSAAWQAYRCF